MLMCKLCCKQVLRHDKVLGEVYVPVRELLLVILPYEVNDTNCGNFQVVKPYGNHKGNLGFS